MEKIAVLTSGGLDSSVLLAEEARDAEVHPIYVKCGLKWEEAELMALRSFLAALANSNVRPVTELCAPAEPMYGDHWSVSGTGVPGAEEPDSSVFLPGRNVLLIGLAAVWCSTHDVSRIAIGSLGGNPFSDATPEFFDQFARVLSVGTGRRITVKALFRNLHKADIIRQFSHLPLELTLTCMAPNGGRAHCGRCNKCRERQIAFEQAGVPDRTTYAL